MTGLGHKPPSGARQVLSVAECEAELIGAKADVAHWAGASVSLRPPHEA